METERIKIIFVYSINDKNKVIGKLENISLKESLKEIRPKIKRMTQNDEFVKPTNNYNFDIFDKEMEQDFSLNDILIKENNVYKINIKPNENKNIIINNNLNNINNINFTNKKKNMINNNMMNNNFDINNNINMHKVINDNTNSNNIFNYKNINNDNNMNNLFNMTNMMNNNMNNMNNMDNIINNNMINKNIINNVVNNNNMNFLNNFINNEDMNDMNNMNDINNIKDLNNNKINKKFKNNQMDDNFLINYNVLFRTTNNIDYFLTVNGRTKIDKLIHKYERKMGINHELQYIYCGKKIEIVSHSYTDCDSKNENFSVFDYFKNNKNPVTIVKDDENLVGKLINVTYLLDNGEKY